MTINPRKLLALPESKKSNISKIQNSIVLNKKSAIVKLKHYSFDFESENENKKQNISSPSRSKIDSRLLRIEKKVIKIDDLFKDFLSQQRKQFKQNSVKQETKNREKREKDLEKNVKKPSGVKLPDIPKPKLGLFDWIKRFITNVILGFIAVRLIDQLPKLAKLIPIINGIMDTVIDWGGKLLDGLVTFIDWGYKAVDASRKFVSDTFGENGVKTFDRFSSKFKDLVNYSLIAAMLISDAGDSIIGGFGSGGNGGFDFGGGRGGVKSEIIDAGGFRKYKGRRWQGFGLNDILRTKGIDVTQTQTDNAIMKRYFQRFGKDAFIERFGEEGIKKLPKALQRGLLTRLGRRLFVGLLGKGGAKTVLKFVKPFTEKLPIIGAFLDFGLSVALGESVGRAAFRAIGAAILGAIGTAVGSVIPIAGNIIGSIGGSMLGDWAGGALYDLFFGNKVNKKTDNSQSQEVQKYASGGVTRGGKYISTTPQRKIQTKKVLRKITPPTMSLQAGRSVGGSEKSTFDLSKTKIETYYPQKTGEKEVKPYQYLKSTHKNVTKVSFLGSLFGLTTKSIFGDKPSTTDYWNVSEGLNSWINTIFGKLNMGYENGGLVNEDISNEDIRNWLAITIQNSVSPTINKVINDLMKQLLLKPYSGQGGPSPSNPNTKPTQEDPNAQFQGQSDFVIGDNIAHGFAGRSGDGDDKSDSKKGRKPAEVLAILKSKGESLRGKLIDLSTGIANSKEDWQTVEEQLKYLKSMNARVRLLGVGKQWDEKVGGNQVNAKLQQLASQYGDYFYGGHNASGDKTLGLQGTPQDYAELKERLSSTQTSMMMGNVKYIQPGTFIQGMTGRVTGPHFHIGPTELYDPMGDVWYGKKTEKGKKDSREGAFAVAKALIQSKTPFTMTNAGISINPNNPPNDSVLSSDIVREQNAHMSRSMGSSWGGIDFAGASGIRLPLAVGKVVSSVHGFGNAARILGTNAFVGHGAPGSTESRFGGGLIFGNNPKVIKTHDDEYVIDKDSVDLFGLPFIDLINRIENQSQLKSNISKLMTMLDYEEYGSRKIVVDIYLEENSNDTYIVDNQTNISVVNSDSDELSYLWDYV